MGAFEKGHAKLGGRVAGTKNKNTELKEFIGEFLTKNKEEFEEAFKKLPPKEKCAVYLKAAEFRLPKISSVQFEDDKLAESAVELLKRKSQY